MNNLARTIHEGQLYIIMGPEQNTATTYQHHPNHTKVHTNHNDERTPLNSITTNTLRMQRAPLGKGQVLSGKTSNKRPDPTCDKCGAKESETTTLTLCTCCKLAYYCSNQCQIDDREHHLADCRRLCIYTNLRHCDDCTATGCSTCVPCKQTACLQKGYPRHCNDLCDIMDTMLTVLQWVDDNELTDFKQNTVIYEEKPAIQCSDI
jgi:hypothetical protein